MLKYNAMNYSGESSLKKAVESVQKHFRRHKSFGLNRDLIRELVELSFFASMKTEELRSTVCTLALVDFNNPAGDDPLRIRPQRRSYVALDQLIPLSVRNIAKISQAAPPWAACIAVLVKDGRLFISGFFDQEIHFRNSVNMEGSDRFDRPGLFQVELVGVGSLSVYDDSVLIATINQDAIVTSFYDVLNIGPFAKKLKQIRLPGYLIARSLVKRKGVRVPVEYLKAEFDELWVAALSRILLGIKRSGHGGAVLLTAGNVAVDMSIKHKIVYQKLHDIIPQHVAQKLIEDRFWRQIHGEFLDVDDEFVPTSYYLSEAVAGNNVRDCEKGELGCVNFISSLARVDGCLWLVDGLQVGGFGVELTCREDPPVIFSAQDDLGRLKKLRVVELGGFGTRHRSMIRYCWAHPGSLGFVVSQDGDVRAIMRIRSRLIIWENILLQYITLSTPARETV